MGDLFSSSRDIEHLFKDEEQLQFMMQGQLIAVQKQVKILDWFLDTFYGEGYENYTEADAEEYVSNPINTYCLLKRTALHWPRVKEVIFNDTVDAQMEDLIGMMNKTSQPPALNGAFSGLFSMQQMYNLPTTMNYLQKIYKILEILLMKKDFTIERMHFTWPLNGKQIKMAGIKPMKYQI